MSPSRQGIIELDKNSLFTHMLAVNGVRLSEFYGEQRELGPTGVEG